MARTARLEMNTTLSDHTREVAATDRAAALAFFLMDQGQSVTGQWSGRMSAADQRALFARVIGKGRIYIDGATETVEMTVSADYTGMRSTEVMQPWVAIDGGYIERRLGVGFDNRVPLEMAA